MKHETARKLIVTAVGFAAAFVLVMALFFKKPHILRTRNRLLRAFMVFSVAFVPGVMAASVCAAGLIRLSEKLRRRKYGGIIQETSSAGDESSAA
ncbi:MAG: hypothetical protein IJ071_04540 [Ruminococcus sp.]|nr:hypothetical protein [Ruminococcus sp.]